MFVLERFHGADRSLRSTSEGGGSNRLDSFSELTAVVFGRFQNSEGIRCRLELPVLVEGSSFGRLPP
jgi:hypothetical protein